MMQYRVVVEVPGAEKPLQTFCDSETGAFRLLEQYLAGRPDGTTYKVYRCIEQVLKIGKVGE
jgi:hypothetical protein